MASRPIGVVGDRNLGHKTHLLTESALRQLPQEPAFEWVPTKDLAGGVGSRLDEYGGLLISPGSPYRSMEGAVAAIRHARERGLPLLGTCGGFQHIVIEFVRNVLGIVDADHAETNPTAPHLAVTPLACSLAGQSHLVTLAGGTKAAEIYQTQSAIEPFFCNFGLNRAYIPMLDARGLRVSGVSEDGEPRVLELVGHPFFVGTLYVPQARSTSYVPHPLLQAFVVAALGARV